ncbi:MAG: hypothetical protein UH242_09095 [Methanobrevibacter sp.]|nr:hypothetical protein [Methanobrevibacter sp.]
MGVIPHAGSNPALGVKDTLQQIIKKENNVRIAYLKVSWHVKRCKLQ